VSNFSSSPLLAAGLAIDFSGTDKAFLPPPDITITESGGSGSPVNKGVNETLIFRKTLFNDSTRRLWERFQFAD
jgi:hypothetical protein